MNNNSPKIRGRDKFKKFEWIINISIKIVKLFPVSFRKYFLRLFQNVNGIIGIGIRYILITSIAKKCGKNVSIHPGVWIFFPENLRLGDNISIHPMSYIDAAGEIDIGNDVSIAHGTTILSSTHTYKNKRKNIKDQPVKTTKTILKNNIWVGSKVTILNGITIGSGSVIAASAVVTKNVLENSVMAGVPAIKIKNR